MRQDLQLRQQAANEGFIVKDGRTIGDPLVFSKGENTVWECVRNGKVQWAVATLDNGRYTKHTYHDDLRHALDDANNPNRRQE